MKPKSNLFGQRLLFISLISVLGIAMLRVHVRVETTLLGYDLAQLKNQEAQLLEQQGQLRMTLAKLTSHSTLERLAQRKPEQQSDTSLLALQ